MSGNLRRHFTTNFSTSILKWRSPDSMVSSLGWWPWKHNELTASLRHYSHRRNVRFTFRQKRRSFETTSRKSKYWRPHSNWEDMVKFPVLIVGNHDAAGQSLALKMIQSSLESSNQFFRDQNSINQIVSSTIPSPYSTYLNHRSQVFAWQFGHRRSTLQYDTCTDDLKLVVFGLN